MWNWIVRATSLALALGAAPAFAGDACGLITPGEASAALGAPGTARPGPAACTITAPGARLVMRLATLTPGEAARLAKHLDEARGDEEPSLHGDPWYEISAVDPERPQDRTMIIYRDRTSLTIEAQSALPDERAALERIWLDIAHRLPTDEPAP